MKGICEEGTGEDEDAKLWSRKDDNVSVQKIQNRYREPPRTKLTVRHMSPLRTIHPSEDGPAMESIA